MVHATEEGVRTLVLDAELRVHGDSTYRWEPTEDWPEAFFVPHTGQSACPPVHLYWEECLVYIIYLFLATCVNLDFGLNSAQGPQTQLPLKLKEESVPLHPLPRHVSQKIILEPQSQELHS